MAQGILMTANPLTMAMLLCMPMTLHSHGKELIKETDMGEPCLYTSNTLAQASCLCYYTTDTASGNLTCSERHIFSQSVQPR